MLSSLLPGVTWLRYGITPLDSILVEGYRDIAFTRPQLVDSRLEGSSH